MHEALHTSQPLPVSHAAKNSVAWSVMDAMEEPNPQRSTRCVSSELQHSRSDTTRFCLWKVKPSLRRKMFGQGPQSRKKVAALIDAAKFKEETSCSLKLHKATCALY